jgi:hypothetical protein
MHAVFEQMNAIRYPHGGTVQIRSSVWIEWMRQIQQDIQPTLDAAQHLVDQGFTATVSPTDAQALIETRAKARRPA